MENSPIPSFIPQQPSARQIVRTRSALSLSAAIAWTIFFVALLVAGIVWGYGFVLNRELQDLQSQLAAEESKIDLAQIEKFKRIDDRLRLATHFVRDHEAFSSVIDLLRVNTSQKVGYTSLRFSQSDTDAPKLELEGQAESYGSLYYQVYVLRNAPFVKSTDVTSVQLDEKNGTVRFGLTLGLDPALFSYERIYNEQMAAIEAAQRQAATVAPVAATTTVQQAATSSSPKQ